MENFTRQIIFGQRPVRRSDPKPGESEWYYFDPRGASTFDEMKTIDVPSEDSPNPFKDEIQNDLYANDAYNYRQLFGDTPPPKLGMRLDGMQPLNDENSYTTESAWNYPNNTQSSYYQKMGRPYDMNRSNIDYSLYGEGFSKEFIDQMLTDSDYQRALNEYAIPNEKGYVNNKNDPGGETNMGIAKRYHPNEDIKNLTRERANAILYNEVWNWNGINKLPREIRGFVFDHGIRTSPQNAIETTHRALGINPVGDIIGNKTLGLLQNTNYEDFLRKYQDLVREQDKNNLNYRYFGKGWNNRTNGYHVSY